MGLRVHTAGVLPGLPHQEGLRGDRAEHLSPQPRLWSHVLTPGLGALDTRRLETNGAVRMRVCVRGGVVGGGGGEGIILGLS